MGLRLSKVFNVSIILPFVILRLLSLPKKYIDIATLVLSLAMAAPWQAKPGCPQHLRDALERFVNDRDPTWRHPPARKGEVFDSFDQCQERLNTLAMVESFAITVRGGGNSITPCKRFQCVHHDEETRNHRALEHRVEMDSERKLISQRQ